MEQPARQLAASGEHAGLDRLKDGEGPAIFLVHGIGGSPNDFVDVVKHIDLPNAIYGVRMCEPEGEGGVSGTVECLAERFLETVRREQLAGPHLLIGYSLGGLVVLEAARRLRECGDTVALLAMVDSYPPFGSLTRGQQLRLTRRLLARRVKSLLGRRLKRDGDPSAARHERSPRLPLASGRRGAHDRAYRAWKRYRTGFYDGPVRFVQAAKPTNFPDNARAVWTPLVGGLEIDTMPGDHVEMIEIYPDLLGVLLTRYLRAALRTSGNARRPVPVAG